MGRVGLHPGQPGCAVFGRFPAFRDARRNHGGTEPCLLPRRILRVSLPPWSHSPIRPLQPCAWEAPARPAASRRKPLLAGPLRIDTSNARGVRFACLPGCGLCCATSPSVLPADLVRAKGAGLPVVRRADGTLGLRMEGDACAALDGARACTKYVARPLACRSFPVQLHALERLQADLHLGCPGLTAGGLGEDAEPLARRIAEEAVRSRALDLDAAARNARVLGERLAQMGFPEPAAEVAGSFAGYDPTEPETLAGLYAAATVAALAPEEVDDAIADGAEALDTLPALLAEVARETPRRSPDHADAALGWKPLDLARADPAAALAWQDRAPLAAHAERLAARDLTWGHALKLVDATGYAVSPSAAYARVLADAGAGLLLRASLLADSAEAIASFEWHYWGLPTVGAAL